MSEEPTEPWEEKFREKMNELDRKIKEIEQLKESLQREVEEEKVAEEKEPGHKVYTYGRPSFRVLGKPVRIRIAENEDEPGVEITTNISKMIKDSLRKSFADLGEDTMSEIIDEMPEEMASAAMKNVSIPDRVKILKLLYYGSKSYGEIAQAFPPDYAKSSLQHHLQKLRNVRLIERGETSGDYEITSRGRSLLRLMGIFYGALKGGDLGESGSES